MLLRRHRRVYDGDRTSRGARLRGEGVSQVRAVGTESGEKRMSVFDPSRRAFIRRLALAAGGAALSLAAACGPAAQTPAPTQAPATTKPAAAAPAPAPTAPPPTAAPAAKPTTAPAAPAVPKPGAVEIG